MSTFLRPRSGRLAFSSDPWVLTFAIDGGEVRFSRPGQDIAGVAERLGVGERFVSLLVYER